MRVGVAGASVCAQLRQPEGWVTEGQLKGCVTIQADDMNVALQGAAKRERGIMPMGFIPNKINPVAKVMVSL